MSRPSLGTNALIAAVVCSLLVTAPVSTRALDLEAQVRVQTAPAMSNQDVIDLAKAGFGDEIIIAQVQSAKTKAFDLTTKGLIALKAAGVSERVLAVLLGSPDPGKPQAPPSVPAANASGGTVAPEPHAASAREAGIYFEEEDGRLTQLEPAVFSGGKTGGVLSSALTYGIKKAKWKAVVRSPFANQRIYTALPVFQFYFERTGSGLSNASTFFGATSPNEFALVRMEVDKKERQLVVGEMGAFGASSGTRSEDTIPLKVEKLQPGVYRVSVSTPLTIGEYCFFYAAGASSFMAAGSGKLFDFGIQRK